MHFSTLAFLAGLFVASTNAVVTPVPEICCISGGGPDPCGSVVGKPLLMNPVPLASLPPTSICCCSAANDLNCRNICGCHCSARGIMCQCEEWKPVNARVLEELQG
ncbi:hypothetical protein B0H13DRAFT_1878047 [Mycena leptocephala]|nr:hypothetical protein B0H13DRAFT_1878047 [Mycena leptocephala]